MNPFVIIINILLYSIVAFSLNWTFPNDHGIHPNYDTEWYYITGHLTDSNNELHGFQVTFFRHSLAPIPNNASPWNTPNLYTAHFAITNGEKQSFNHYETMARDAYKMAEGDESYMNVRINDWQIEMKNNAIFIDINIDDGHLKLKLKSDKPIVFHGDNGYSKKSNHSNHFSYYYSFTRLKGSGDYQIGDDFYTITSASAWMDREIFNQLLDQEQIGWDWFAIQLDNGCEIMAFQVRSETGEPYYSGSFVGLNGDVKSLSKENLKLTALDYWESEKSNNRYPIKWKLSLPSLNQEYIITARFNNQELYNTIPFPFYYWEGQSLVTGSTTGKAYMELVGY